MPSRTTLDDLRAAAEAAYALYLNEADPDRRLGLHLEYYRAAQAVLVEERRQRHSLPDGYRTIPDGTP